MPPPLNTLTSLQWAMKRKVPLLSGILSRRRRRPRKCAKFTQKTAAGNRWSARNASEPDIYSPKHESSIFRQSDNSVSDVPWSNRLHSVLLCPQRTGLALTSTRYRAGWMCENDTLVLSRLDILSEQRREGKPPLHTAPSSRLRSTYLTPTKPRVRNWRLDVRNSPKPTLSSPS